MNQLRGVPGGYNQLQGMPGGYNQLQAQQMYQLAQLRALQQQQTAASLSVAANTGYSNYARMYAAQQKRIAERQRQAELHAGR